MIVSDFWLIFVVTQALVGLVSTFRDPPLSGTRSGRSELPNETTMGL